MIALAPLEAAATARTPERVPLAIAAFQALERGELFADGVQPAEGFGRLAAAAARVFGDSELALDVSQAWTLAFYGGLLNSLFAAVGDWPQSPRLRTLDSPELAPSTSLAEVLGQVATSPVLTAGGAARRERLLEDVSRLDGEQLPASTAAMTVASAAWMTCSYASGPHKHGLKPVLNRAFRSLLADLRLPDSHPPQPRPIPERPTLVVIAEVIHGGHVQFRYFGQYLRQLATRFRLVLVAPQRELGPAVEALFDEVFAFDPYGRSDFAPEVVGFVRRIAPDIVFWPSVGMARWGPLLANLRLAPIQMTALGHSASTFIPTMDYYLTEEGYVSDPALFSETLLLVPDDSLRFERPPGYQAVAPEIRERAEPVRIAIPSNVLKLNPGFLALLGRVKREAERPVQFHLFPNASLLTVAALRAAQREVLDGAVVYPRLGAQAYLEALNACDLVLSPLPFGGLHSVVDALRQGLPVVCMDRPEPHGRTDAMILRRLGMPDSLIASTENEYVAAALRLIDDDDARMQMSRRALDCDVDAVMFGDATTPLGCAVVDAVWAALRHHEAIQADGRGAWRLADLVQLG